MKVWCVFHYLDLIAIFSTEEKAAAYATLHSPNFMRRGIHKFDAFSMNEVEVDSTDIWMPFGIRKDKAAL